jgi:hypothetical protein
MRKPREPTRVFKENSSEVAREKAIDVGKIEFGSRCYEDGLIRYFGLWPPESKRMELPFMQPIDTVDPTLLAVGSCINEARCRSRVRVGETTSA